MDSTISIIMIMIFISVLIFSSLSSVGIYIATSDSNDDESTSTTTSTTTSQSAPTSQSTSQSTPNSNSTSQSTPTSQSNSTSQSTPKSNSISTKWTNTFAPLNFFNTSKCIGVASQNKNNSALIVSWECGGQDDQQFKLNDQGQLVNKNSNKCLRVKSSGKTNATPVTQWTCSEKATDAEKWVYDSNTKLFKNPNSGKCLNALGGAPGDGNHIGIFDCNKTFTNSLIV
jgi:hypothetical protein